MALPPVVLDVLNSLKIATLPPQVNVGDRVDLGLSPGLNAFDLLSQPPKLFDIELNNITLDNIAIDLTDINLGPIGAPGQERFQLTLDAINAPGSAAGTTDLELVSKAVEFNPLSPPTGTTATDIDTNETSLHALPHLIPNANGLLILSTAVKGLLSRITGTVRQVEKFSGGITGNVGGHIKGRITGTINNLKGSVKAPQLLPSAPVPAVEWYIEDGNGKRLAENVDFVMLNSTGLTNPAPSLAFLPVFAELSAGVDLISRRRIFCKVTVTVGSDTKDRLLGPVDIVLPKIQLPTVLVMTEHAVTGKGYPGAVLVAVPSQSLLQLDQLIDKLQEVQVVLNRLQTVSQVIGFGETVEQINRITELIGNPSIRVPRFVKADGVMDLWYVMRMPGGFLGFGYESWEDCISSLIMIGPPGRVARFYNAKNFWERRGAFEIVLGRKAVGHIDTLDASIPTCEPPPPDGCTFSHRWEPPPPSFNDIISSYQFLPLQ
jgi:hypothetical protein